MCGNFKSAPLFNTVDPQSGAPSKRWMDRWMVVDGGGDLPNSMKTESLAEKSYIIPELRRRPVVMIEED